MNATCSSYSKRIDVWWLERMILSYASIASGGLVSSARMKKGGKQCLRSWDASPVNGYRRAFALARSIADSATYGSAITMRCLEEILGTTEIWCEK